MGDMGCNEEVLIEPASATSDPVHIMVLCMADVGGKTQRMAISKTIHSQDERDTVNGSDGALNVTVNVLNVAPRGAVGPYRNNDRKNERRNSVRASSRYWMDSLPCLSSRQTSR